MNAALKEWAAITDALLEGRQVAILRKGGIVEAQRGGFTLRHDRFLLFPTHEHQHARFLRTPSAEPADGLHIEGLAECAVIQPAPAQPAALQSLGDEFVWNEAFVRQRYEYRPDLPLWLIVLRIHRLPQRVVIPDRASYAGCKSWVNLTEDIDVSQAVPVLGDAAFRAKRDFLLDRLRT